MTRIRFTLSTARLFIAEFIRTEHEKRIRQAIWCMFWGNVLLAAGFIFHMHSVRTHTSHPWAWGVAGLGLAVLIFSLAVLVKVTWPRRTHQQYIPDSPERE